METEHEAGILTYRYVYGLEKAHVVIYGIEGGAGILAFLQVFVNINTSTARIREFQSLPLFISCSLRL